VNVEKGGYEARFTGKPFDFICLYHFLSFLAEDEDKKRDIFLRGGFHGCK
jgi:hypothetical protein